MSKLLFKYNEYEYYSNYTLCDTTIGDNDCIGAWKVKNGLLHYCMDGSIWITDTSSAQQAYQQYLLSLITGEK